MATQGDIEARGSPSWSAVHWNTPGDTVVSNIAKSTRLISERGIVAPDLAARTRSHSSSVVVPSECARTSGILCARVSGTRKEKDRISVVPRD